jgi:hypothetical protein
LCILCVNLCLVAGMVVGLQWALGAVEAVSITVFVGKHARSDVGISTRYRPSFLRPVVLSLPLNLEANKGCIFHCKSLMSQSCRFSPPTMLPVRFQRGLHVAHDHGLRHAYCVGGGVGGRRPKRPQ